MSPLFYFYLIHFLADYPLQSSSLVKYKKKHFLGVFIHSTVHLITLLIVLIPFLPNNRVWIAIATIYITHNIIDQAKVMLNKAYPKRITFFYFLDQLVHCVIITACAFYVGLLTPQYLTGWAMDLYSSQTFVLYLLVMVLSTYFYDVSCHFIKGDHKKAFKRDIRTMLKNAAIVTIAFGVYWIAY